MSAAILALTAMLGVWAGMRLQARFGVPTALVEQVIVTTPDAYSETLSGAIRKVSEGMKLVGDDPHWLISHTVEMQAEGRPSLWLIVRNREHVQ